MADLIQVTLAKSAIGYPQRQKDTVRALGLRRLGDTAVHVDSPPIRGMVTAVDHLVTVEALAPAEVEATTDELPEDDE
jgi:large subunit ribosomal protein L30